MSSSILPFLLFPRLKGFPGNSSLSVISVNENESDDKPESCGAGDQGYPGNPHLHVIKPFFFEHEQVQSRSSFLMNL